MPKIDKVKIIKKKPNLPVVKATKKKTKKDPVAYYGCLSAYAQKGFPTKITTCCKNCKQNAPILLAQRQSEIKKLITSYRAVGESLSKLLVH